MTTEMTLAKLKRLLEDHEPAEIRAQYADALTPECEAYLREWDSLEQDLWRVRRLDLEETREQDLFPEEGQERLSATPKMSFMHASFRIPYWCAAAAVLTLGMVGLVVALKPTVLRPEPDLGCMRGSEPPDVLNSPAMHKANKKLGEAYLERGVLWFEAATGDSEGEALESAVADLESAAALMPDHPRVLQYLALAYERQGHREQAESCLKRWEKTINEKDDQRSTIDDQRSTINDQ